MLIISRAHEVYQRNPPNQNTLICVRCNRTGSIKDLFGEQRCHPHFELKSSGWLDESTEEEKQYLKELKFE